MDWVRSMRFTGSPFAFPLYIYHGPLEFYLDSMAESGRDYFTVVTEVGEKSPKHGAIAFVGKSQSPQGGERRALVALGLVRPSGAVATAVRRFRVHGVQEIPPLDMDDLIVRLPKAVRASVTDARNRNRQLPPAAQRELIKIISSQHPDVGRFFGGMADELSAEISRAQTHIFNEERDAVGFALEVFGSDRSAITSVRPAVDGAPFLHSLTNPRILEDALIWHDTNHFRGLLDIQGSQPGVMVSRSPSGRTLTIFNVNRTPVETSLGVDLIYYNHGIDSYTLVQYKKMTLENGTWRYRGDSSLSKEVERMRSVEIDSEIRSAAEYRFNSDPFYLKIVRPVDYAQTDSELLTGMYIPLSLLLVAMNDPEHLAKGSKKNLVLEWGDIPYIRRTQFRELLNHGLIGTRGLTSQVILETIKNSLENDRSIVLAVEEDRGGFPGPS